MTADPRAELLAVFDDLRALLSQPDNDFSWSSWFGADDALAEVDEISAAIRAARTAADLPKFEIRSLFVPTGPVQEVSLSSGWGARFLTLADRCDAALEATS
ncbi:hypothetical protein JGU71_11545 [Antrihabitans sp. YC3-6]|uniref:Uncharacterized protein n=1 Tax=Antrihabitans stalagmiti TaxID=2799499 RepID=A0A934NQN0_9NOCA|nr:hypothetical protein [Antrihabitans stalagmiti]MBJ8339520.1 hypothetical protein [Antrihabitans stalagmiti]